MPYSFDRQLIKDSVVSILKYSNKRTGILLLKVTSHPKFLGGYGPRNKTYIPQVSATCLYPRPAQSSPYTHIPPPGDPS